MLHAFASSLLDTPQTHAAFARGYRKQNANTSRAPYSAGGRLKKFRTLSRMFGTFADPDVVAPVFAFEDAGTVVCGLETGAFDVAGAETPRERSIICCSAGVRGN